MTQRTLLLMRHGLPDYSVKLSPDEPPGPPLSETGYLQAAQAVDVLRSFEPETLRCSPLTRTLATANVISKPLGLIARVDSDLKEWHRTESLYQVNERSARWLRAWIAGRERCAVVVGHASPLLSLMRSALYLPQFGMWVNRDPNRLRLGTADRFEFSMASVFELAFTEREVIGRCLHHPDPRILYVDRHRRRIPTGQRPAMCDAGNEMRRPRFDRLIGYSLASAGRIFKPG